MRKITVKKLRKYCIFTYYISFKYQIKKFITVFPENKFYAYIIILLTNK